MKIPLFPKAVEIAPDRSVANGKRRRS